MNKNYVADIMWILLLSTLLSCTNETNKKDTFDLFKYEKFELFKDWVISPREKSVIIFDKVSSDSVENRFLVKREGSKILLLDTKDSPKTYVEYSDLATEKKEVISIEVINAYYELDYDEVIYKDEQGNSFLIISNAKKTYWYFFKFNPLNPPMMISNFDKIDDKWYVFNK